jgi:hypothetical protein
MSTSRPFAKNTGSPIVGTLQIGNLAIGYPTEGFESTGLKWWNGPDEDLGYVIAHEDLTGRPGADDVTAYIGFWRTEAKTESDFIDLAEHIAFLDNDPQNFADGGDAKDWLNSNGYWTSYTSFVQDSLVLYYDPSDPTSYSGSGTSINDLSENSLNGTLSNIGFTSPYFLYNGASSQLTVPDNPLLEPGSGSWTTEAWFSINSFGASSVILGKFDNGGSSQHVSYSIRLNTFGNLFAQYSNGNIGVFVNSTNYQISTNTPYQVVYVWTNSGGTKTLETFINGVSIGTVNHSFNSILNSSNPLYLGSYNGGEYSQWLNGKTGVVRIYNKALTASEVLQNFNFDKSKYGL